MWTNETYAVYLSETDTELASFTKELIKENISSPIRRGPASTNAQKNADVIEPLFFDRTIDLKDYVGKEVYIAFRHFEGANDFCIVLDNVLVHGKDPSQTTPAHSFNIYREGVFVKNVAEPSFSETLSNYGVVNYEIEVKYADGQLSPKVPVKATILDVGDGTVRVYLKADNVWGDGSGYQMLLDQTAQLYGEEIPENGPLVQGCDVPADLQGKFSHFIPANADISCAPEHMVVSGEEMIQIPAGTYDFCFTNGEAGVNVWIAFGGYGRANDFKFEAGYEYRFELMKDGPTDTANLQVLLGVKPITSNTKVYAADAAIVVESDQPASLVIFDLQGRRLSEQRVEAKAIIPVATQSTYVVQVKVGEDSETYKVLVK